MTVYNPRTVEKNRVMSERMQIYGEVIVRQGRKIVARGRNKFVGQALLSLCNAFSEVPLASTPQTARLFTSGHPTPNASDTHAIGNQLSMRLGTDTATPTAYDMVKLVAYIATAPNSFVIDRDNPSSGVYRAKFVATWNTGTVSGTIGELGLYCDLQKTLGSQVLSTFSLDTTLWSRLSSASGDFSQFTIDTGKPLSVEWRIVFQF